MFCIETLFNPMTNQIILKALKCNLDYKTLFSTVSIFHSSEHFLNNVWCSTMCLTPWALLDTHWRVTHGTTLPLIAQKKRHNPLDGLLCHQIFNSKQYILAAYIRHLLERYELMKGCTTDKLTYIYFLRIFYTVLRWEISAFCLLSFCQNERI